MKAFIVWPGGLRRWIHPIKSIEVGGETLKIVNGAEGLTQHLVVEREFEDVLALALVTDSIVELLKREHGQEFDVRIQEDPASGSVDFRTLAVRLDQRLRALTTEPETEEIEGQQLVIGDRFILKSGLKCVVADDGMAVVYDASSDPHGFSRPGKTPAIPYNEKVRRILE